MFYPFITTRKNALYSFFTTQIFKIQPEPEVPNLTLNQSYSYFLNIPQYFCVNNTANKIKPLMYLFNIDVFPFMLPVFALFDKFKILLQ